MSRTACLAAAATAAVLVPLVLSADEPRRPASASVSVFLRQKQAFISAYQSGPEPALALQRIPVALGCEWTEREATGPTEIYGTCQNWPTDNTLNLQPLVLALHQAGLQTLRLTVMANLNARQVKQPAPAGWKAAEYSSSRNLQFVSRSSEELPAALTLEPASAKTANDEPEYEAPTTLSVNASISVSPSGRVRISAYAQAPDDVPAHLFDGLPALIGCKDKSPAIADEFSSVTLNCREYLTRDPGLETGRLDLAPLVKALRARGVEEITLDVSPPLEHDTPKGWETKTGHRRSGATHFSSRTAADIPPPLVLPVDPPANLWNFVISALTVMLGPALLGLLIRLRHHLQPSFNWLVWFQWLQLSPLLYWVMSARVADIDPVTSLLIGSYEWLRLPMAIVLAEGPLLVGMVSSLFALRSLFTRSKQGFRDTVTKVIFSQAAILVPLALFYQSGEILGPGIGSVICMPVAYGLYRLLSWLGNRTGRRNITPVNAGPLYDRTLALAAKAGVRLSRLSILESRSPEEINAFAISGGRVMVTESLLQNLTEREVDAVVAHEVGHHKAGHLTIPWIYVLFGAALASGYVISWFVTSMHLPQWIAHTPFPMVLALIANGLISQHNEYAADRHAAELTGDPEGKIAALGRLARINQLPIGRGGWLASIMTHPSMEERALALGRRFGVPDLRALAIIRNPDEAYVNGVAPLARAVYASEPTAAPALFSDALRARWVAQKRWLLLLVPLASVTLVGTLGGMLFTYAPRSYWFGLYSGVAMVSMLCAPVAALIGLVKANQWLDRRRILRLRDQLAPRLQPLSSATFVGLHPGHGIRVTEGFTCVEFGFLTLDQDWLIYRGEQFRFAIPRADVFNISLVSGPFRWSRSQRLEVEYSDGAFTVGDPTPGAIEELFDRVQDWRRQDTSIATRRPEPAPQLPDLPGSAESRWYLVWYAAKESGKLLILAVALSAMRWMGPALSSLWAPAVVIAYLLPLILWPNRPPAARAPAQRRAVNTGNAPRTLMGM